jgi:hypothetical protein
MKLQLHNINSKISEKLKNNIFLSSQEKGKEKVLLNYKFEFELDGHFFVLTGKKAKKTFV